MEKSDVAKPRLPSLPFLLKYSLVLLCKDIEDDWACSLKCRPQAPLHLIVNVKSQETSNTSTIIDPQHRQNGGTCCHHPQARAATIHSGLRRVPSVSAARTRNDTGTLTWSVNNLLDTSHSLRGKERIGSAYGAIPPALGFQSAAPITARYL